MSIRGRGPDDVVVQPKRWVRDKGSKVLVDDGPPVEVKNCDVQSVREWATSEEDLTNGVVLLSLRRVFARTWPGDENALIYHKGWEFESVGDPQEMGRTKKTAHWVIHIRRLGQKPPPPIPPAP